MGSGDSLEERAKHWLKDGEVFREGIRLFQKLQVFSGSSCVHVCGAGEPAGEIA